MCCMSTLTRKTLSRKTVPVTAEDTRTVDRVREPHSAHRAALAELLGVELSANPSEAEVLQALVEAGRMALEQQVMVTGYAALAAAQDEEDREYELAMRGRRRGARED
jgi:hypothetical protein